MNAAQAPAPARELKPVCNFFQRTGTCRFGARCRFSHELPQVGGEREWTHVEVSFCVQYSSAIGAGAGGQKLITACFGRASGAHVKQHDQTRNGVAIGAVQWARRWRRCAAGCAAGCVALHLHDLQRAGGPAGALDSTSQLRNRGASRCATWLRTQRQAVPMLPKHNVINPPSCVSFAAGAEAQGAAVPPGAAERAGVVGPRRPRRAPAGRDCAPPAGRADTAGGGPHERLPDGSRQAWVGLGFFINPAVENKPGNLDSILVYVFIMMRLFASVPPGGTPKHGFACRQAEKKATDWHASRACFAPEGIAASFLKCCVDIFMLKLHALC